MLQRRHQWPLHSYFHNRDIGLIPCLIPLLSYLFTSRSASVFLWDLVQALHVWLRMCVFLWCVCVQYQCLSVTVNYAPPPPLSAPQISPQLQGPLSEAVLHLMSYYSRCLSAHQPYRAWGMDGGFWALCMCVWVHVRVYVHVCVCICDEGVMY